MKRYKKPYELKNMAKDTLQGKYGAAVLILFLYNLITGLVSMFISLLASTTSATAYAMTESSSVVTVITIVFEIISFAAVAVLRIMEAGITLFFLNIACNQPYAINNLFHGFSKDSSGKTLTLSIVWGLCSTVCLYPYQYCFSAYWNSRDIRMLYITLIVMAVGICVYVPIYLSLSQIFYLMLDYPDLSAKEILALSIRVMKGNKGRLFYLNLSFVPMMILGLLSFGIGFLWLNPYMRMTGAYFFLDMMKPAEE